MNSRNNEKIVIQPEKRHEILNGLRQVLWEIWDTRKNLSMKRFNCIKVSDVKVGQIKWLMIGQYSVNNNVRFKTPMLRLDLCGYSDAYTISLECRNATK